MENDSGNPTDENLIEVVPLKWISNDQLTCVWPTNHRSKSLTECIKSCHEPDDTWENCNVRVLWEKGNYKEARAKAKQAEVTSELENSESGTPAARLRGRRRRRQLDYSEGPAINLRTPDEEQIINRASEFAPVEAHVPADQLILHQKPLMPVYITAQLDPEFLGQFKAFQELVIEKFEQFGAELQELKSCVQTLLTEKSTLFNSVAVETFPNLPLESQADIHDLETWLEVPENCSALTSLLSKIGGSTDSKIVYNILKRLYGHDLARQVCFTSQSGKLELRKLKICKIIVDAVWNTVGGAHIPETAIYSWIGKWFRNVEDRNGGRVKRRRITDTAE